MASKYHYTSINERWVSIAFVVLVLAAGWLFVSGLGPDASVGKISENNLQGSSGVSGMTITKIGNVGGNEFTMNVLIKDKDGRSLIDASSALGKIENALEKNDIIPLDHNLWVSTINFRCENSAPIVHFQKGRKCEETGFQDREDQKNWWYTQAPIIIDFGSPGYYCIVAGCLSESIDVRTISYDVPKNYLSYKFTVADLGDLSTLEQSSISTNGVACGKGRKCSLTANTCVWNNPNGPGLCRKSGASGAAPTPAPQPTPTPAPEPEDTTRPGIEARAAPSTIYPDTPFSLKYILTEELSNINYIESSAVAKVGAEARCNSHNFWSDPKKVEVLIDSCVAKTSDIGKTIAITVIAVNEKGLITTHTDNIQVIKKPVEPDTKKPRCTISFLGGGNKIAPDSPASARVYCEDDYLAENDMRGTLMTVHADIVHGQTVQEIETMGSESNPWGISNFDQIFVCSKECRQRLFSGDQQGETFSISVTATDFRGNAQTFGYNFKVRDITPPTCQIYYNTPGDLEQTNKEIKRSPNSVEPIRLKCSDNIALAPGVKFYRAYAKTNGQESEEEFAATFPSATGEQVASIDLRIPADAKEGSQVLWYVSQARDAEGNEANIPDYGLITVKDITKPTISKTETTRQIIYDGGKFSIFTTANDNVDLGEIKLKAKKQGSANYEDVQTLSIGGTNIWNLPLEITSSWYNSKKGDLSQAAANFDWKIELKDKEGNQVATQPTGSFTLKAPCSVAKKPITYSDVLPAGGGEYAPGEILTVSGKFKNNYDTSYADCGELMSAFFKYNASISVDGALKLFTGTTPAQTAQFKITIPQPRLPDNRRGIGVIALTGGASSTTASASAGSATGSALNYNLGVGGEDYGFGSGAGSGFVGKFGDPNSAIGSGATILLPGDVVSWKINAWDVSGNTIETPERTFKIKDIEAPTLRADSPPAKIKTGETINLKACARDWNRNNASLKTEASVNGATGSGSSLGGNAIATTTLKNYVLQRIGGVEDCSTVSYSAGSGIKENAVVEFKFTGTDAVGNKTTLSKSAKVMNPPTWTDDRTPKSASPMQKIIFSKFWKDDTSLKSAELWVSTGIGLQKVASSEFEGNVKEGWINFDYIIPKIAGLEKIAWEMRVKDFYGNEGVIDPEVTVVEDKTPPEILQVSQAANEVYSGWSNFIKVKARDNIALSSAVLYVREPGENFKFFTTAQMMGNLSEESLEWKNENLIEGTVQWYVEVEDLNGNRVKSETNSFLVKLQAAPVGLTAPTTTTSTSSTTTTTLKKIEPITTITAATTPPAGGVDYILIGVVALILALAGLAYYFRDKIKEALGIKAWKTPAAEPETPAQQKK